MKKLDGKVALITGGSSGIGLATAEAFVQAGAYVYIMGRNAAPLEQAAAKIGENVTALQGDVAELADLKGVYARVKQEKGRLDVIVANAGIAQYAKLGAISEETYRLIFDTNVKGMLLTIQEALPLMPDGASVILVGSVVGSKGYPMNSVYSASKAAVRSFARTWTADLQDRKIRVNVLSPGTTDTPGLNELIASNAVLQDRITHLHNIVPLGRLVQPAEVAKAAVFLASDDASFITGIELFVDGGIAQI
jgi:NAD(P)-dependent dehydrogenase (short-subunit alcohol dehydrogenase family)